MSLATSQPAAPSRRRTAPKRPLEAHAAILDRKALDARLIRAANELDGPVSVEVEA